MRRKTIDIVTLGCSKNLVDSEHLMRQLEAEGCNTGAICVGYSEECVSISVYPAVGDGDLIGFRCRQGGKGQTAGGLQAAVEQLGKSGEILHVQRPVEPDVGSLLLSGVHLLLSVEPPGEVDDVLHVDGPVIIDVAHCPVQNGYSALLDGEAYLFLVAVADI